MPNQDNTTISGFMEEAVIDVWSAQKKVLVDGRNALLSDGCLVKPAPKDRVLVFTENLHNCTILAILERGLSTSIVLSATNMLAFEGNQATLAAKKIRWASTNFLSSASNHYIAKDLQTEIIKLRITETNTIVRQANTTDDNIHGVLLQRFGTWLSDTAKEVRMKAKQFLFE